METIKKRIAIVGPECTGKSALAEQLAKHYNTFWVREFARHYLTKIKRKYTIDDIAYIAKTQLYNEGRSAALVNEMVFCDTNLLVTKIWAEFVYETCPVWILNNYNPDSYALHLLCDIDLAWQPDPLREHPDKRQELFDRYHQQLKASNANYKIVKGQGEVRLQNAINFVDAL